MPPGDKLKKGLMNRPINEILPEGFHIPMVQPGDWPDGQEDIIGQYFADQGIRLRPEVIKNEDDSTLAHELGHSIYDKDVTKEQSKEWGNIHNNYTRNSYVNPNRDPDKSIQKLMDYLLIQYPSSQKKAPYEIQDYKNDPWHSFAEAVKSYMVHGDNLKNASPPIYNFLKKIFKGKEY
jgi:hypothetical protein